MRARASRPARPLMRYPAGIPARRTKRAVRPAAPPRFPRALRPHRAAAARSGLRPRRAVRSPGRRPGLRGPGDSAAAAVPRRGVPWRLAPLAARRTGQASAPCPPPRARRSAAAYPRLAPQVASVLRAPARAGLRPARGSLRSPGSLRCVGGPPPAALLRSPRGVSALELPPGPAAGRGSPQTWRICSPHTRKVGNIPHKGVALSPRCQTTGEPQ